MYSLLVQYTAYCAVLSAQLTIIITMGVETGYTLHGNTIHNGNSMVLSLALVHYVYLIM